MRNAAYKIAVMPGDGIGHEVMDAALPVLAAAAIWCRMNMVARPAPATSRPPCWTRWRRSKLASKRRRGQHLPIVGEGQLGLGHTL